MKRLNRILLALCAASLFASFIHAQTTEPVLTAREMFLAARDNKTASNAKATGDTKSVKPAFRTPAKTNRTEAAGGTTPAGELAHSRSNSLPREPERERNPDLITASYSNSPLGLRYTIIKREGSRSVDVPTDTVFHNGDQIHVGVEVTEPGFLYIVTRGSSGTWELLFPSPKMENGDNRVGPQSRYVVPQGYVFTFSGKPDTEKLFVVFSRRPEPQIDSLIYSLQDGKATRPTKERSPAKSTDEPLIMAGLKPIDDSVVNMLRSAYSRDLIIEPVNDTGDAKQAGHTAEHSVYVVNPKGGADSRVVADISLTHQ